MHPFPIHKRLGRPKEHPKREQQPPTDAYSEEEEETYEEQEDPLNNLPLSMSVNSFATNC
jgi:hypothetical protein